MAYNKKTWTDRTVERPLTFILQDNGDGTTTLVPSEGDVISTGTPITAANMNNLESQYENAIADGLINAQNWVKGFGLGGDVKNLGATDPNAISETGFYFITSTDNPFVANLPGTYAFYIIHLKSGTGAYQVAFKNSVNNDMYFRRSNAGSWETWKQIAETDSPTFTGTLTSQGKLVASVGGQAFDLTAGPTEDHVYMGFYKDSQALTTRSGWLGFGSALTTDFTIANTLGNIVLLPTSSNVLIGSYGCYLEAPSNGSIYLHKDSLNYLRVTSGQQDMYFGTSQTLTFTNGKIKNGFGGIVIESNSSATAPAILSAPMDYSYVQGRDGTRVTAPGTTATYKPIFASAFTVSSERKGKTNIEPVTEGALVTVLETPIYNYHLIEELEEHKIVEDNRVKIASKNPKKVKKRKGFMVDEVSDDLVHSTIDNTTGEIDSYGIDLGGLTATLWKAVQELNAKVDELKDELAQMGKKK